MISWDSHSYELLNIDLNRLDKSIIDMINRNYKSALHTLELVIKDVLWSFPFFLCNYFRSASFFHSHSLSFWNCLSNSGLFFTPSPTHFIDLLQEGGRKSTKLVFGEDQSAFTQSTFLPQLHWICLTFQSWKRKKNTPSYRPLFQSYSLLVLLTMVYNERLKYIQKQVFFPNMNRVATVSNFCQPSWPLKLVLQRYQVP